MKIRCEATPKKLPKNVQAELLEIDRICFESDEPVETEGCWWWLIRDQFGRPIAFAGLRPCRHKSNFGLAYMTRCGVRLKHRGKGLQKKLIRARVLLARRNGFKEIVTYVLNWNLASANSLIACGFRLYTPASLWAGSKALYFRKVL